MEVLTCMQEAGTGFASKPQTDDAEPGDIALDSWVRYDDPEVRRRAHNHQCRFFKHCHLVSSLCFGFLLAISVHLSGVLPTKSFEVRKNYRERYRTT